MLISVGGGEVSGFWEDFVSSVSEEELGGAVAWCERGGEGFGWEIVGL